MDWVKNKAFGDMGEVYQLAILFIFWPIVGIELQSSATSVTVANDYTIIYV